MDTSPTAASIANAPGFGVALAAHPWAYPAVEALHLAGIAAMVGSLLLVELRVWGLGVAVPLQPLARLALPVTLAGFALAACSGLLMFSTRPAELLASTTFVVKMTLLMLAGLNAAAFHARGSLDKADGVARAQTLASFVLWLAVIGAGRWIAYA